MSERTDQAITTLNGNALSRFGLGCSRFGSFGNPATPRELVQTVHHALDLGVNVFDTADIYGQGDSERILGRAVRSRRAGSFIVTKVGKQFSTKAKILRPLKPLIKPLLSGRHAREAVVAQRGDQMREDFTPAAIRKAIDASLRRLGVDVVDGLLLHSPPATVAADPNVIDVLRQQQSNGRVRYFGLSCDDRASLEAALTIPDLALLQLPVDLIAETADDLGETIRRRGIALFAREAILLRRDLSPPAAVRAAAALPNVTTVLAGTGKVAHLTQLVEALSA
jgi:aryl-alcohol dehydrogenase-like predicted oxidoreductase